MFEMTVTCVENLPFGNMDWFGVGSAYKCKHQITFLYYIFVGVEGHGEIFRDELMVLGWHILGYRYRGVRVKNYRGATNNGSGENGSFWSLKSGIVSM